MDMDVILGLDTRWTLESAYTREIILWGHYADSPIFDRLAADYFASDKATFNLGDYR